MSDTVSLIGELTAIVRAIKDLLDAALVTVPTIAGCMAFAMAFVPPPENKDTRLGKIYSWLNALACNFRYAANKNAPK